MTDRIFSMEFFPPKTPEGAAKLRETRQQLAQLKPRFLSVTFGAGGSTTSFCSKPITSVSTSILRCLARSSLVRPTSGA